MAITDSSSSENQYLNNDHHDGIISKGQFKAAQLEMASHSNVEIIEDGTIRRKSRKYSSKNRKWYLIKYENRAYINIPKQRRTIYAVYKI